MSFNLNPDIEARLIALAQSHGVSVEDFLRGVVEERAGHPAARLTPEQWAEQFETWADSFPEAPAITDEALRRDNLYPDRW